MFGSVIRLALTPGFVLALALAVVQPATAQRLSDRWQETATIARDAADSLIDGVTSAVDAPEEPIDPAFRDHYAAVRLTSTAAEIEADRADAAAIIDPRAAVPLLGTWRGIYGCGQGLTGMTLSLAQWPDGEVEGVMHFYPTEGGPPGGAPKSLILRATSTEVEPPVFGPPEELFQ